MKVLVDLTYINPDYMSGVANYAIRLLQGMNLLHSDASLVVLVDEGNEEYIAKQLSVELLVLPKRRKNSFLKREIRMKRIDLFFSPYLHLWSITTKVIPQIGVVHDLQPLILQSNKIKKVVYKKLLFQKIRKCTTIVSISNYSKSALIKEFNIEEHIIKVIYNSIEWLENYNKSVNDIPTPYILNVNTIVPYKNLITLLKAFLIIKDIIPHMIVIKGKKTIYWHQFIFPFIKASGIEDRVIIIDDNYNDKEMASLYSCADLFVTPSLMEGFGFTPIEAAIYKIPVISTKDAALFETTLEILNYYSESTDEKQLAQLILDVINNENKELDSISQMMKERYSLKKQAKSYLKLFNQVYENRN
jgi:glycosyltransferase involved in cell wall biosynthesis